MDLLTPAEWRVLHALQHGMSNRTMATRLGVSIGAIKYHVRNILAKTGATDRTTLKQRLLAPRESDMTPKGDSVMASTATFGRIGQIARTVGNIEQARNWYELVLELPHLYTFGTLSFFDCGGTRLMLTQNEQLNPNESVLYFKVEDIEANWRRLQDKGVEFISAPHMIHRHEDGTEEWMAFFKDPDDRPLGLMTQTPSA